MKKYFTLILLGFFVFPGLLIAQKGSIRGQVIDDGNGESLFSANAVLKGTLVGATTDFDGMFELSAEPGVYDLEVSFIGMNTVTITGVKVTAGKVNVIEVIRLKTSSSQLAEVTISVEAAKNTPAALITLKKKSTNLVDGISSSELKKTGDSDAGDAAKRVTGVSVEGGKYVYVRGLGDRYTKTMLNGVDIPGLDPDRNAIQIDIFPTNLLENMTVLKTGLAELPADFSGGVVNIETKDFPIQEIFNVSIGAGYNPSMHFNSDYLTYDGGATDFLGFDDGTRKLPAGADGNPIPNPINRQYSDEQINAFMKSFNPTLGAMKQSSFLDYDLGLSYGNQKLLKSGNKLGYVVALTYKNSTRFYDDVVYGEYFRANESTDNELVYATVQEGQLGENSVLLGGVVGLALKTESAKYKLMVMHLQNGESAAGQFKIDNSNNAVGQSGYKAYSNNLSYAERGLTNVLLSGEHHTKEEKWVLDWKLSPTFSNIDEPDLRRTAFTITPQGDSVFNAGAGGNPYRIWRFLNEVNVVGQVNLKRNFTLFEREARLKFGASHVYKQRDFNILSFDLQSFGAQPDYDGNPNNILTNDRLFPDGNLYYNSANGDPNPNQYTSSIQNTGAYVSVEASPSTLLKVVLGLRAENFVQKHTGRDQQGATGNGGNVLDNDKVLESLDLFPSANIIYAVKENQNLRFSYFRSIARPSFKELSFAQIVDPITNRTFNGGLFAIGDWDGNLTETRINNIDLRYEVFMKPGEIISFSGFVKLFNDAIELVRIPEAVTSPNFQPRNVGDGQVFGLEFELRKNLGFTGPVLSKVSFSGNYTYAYSQIEMSDVEFDARKDFEKDGETVERTRAMAGQAPHIINAGLTYDDVMKKMNFGVFYNVKGRTLEVVGGGLYPDVYTEQFHSLNLTASKSFGKDDKSTVSLRVSNILNDDRESFYVGYEAQDQIFSRLSPGTEFSISYTYNFR